MKTNLLLTALTLAAPITAQHVLSANTVPFSPEPTRAACEIDFDPCIVSLSLPSTRNVLTFIDRASA
jgi:hypothetical protein